MRLLTVVVAGLLMLASAAPVWAGQGQTPGTTARLGALRPAQPTDPYKQLFAPNKQLSATREALKQLVAAQQARPALGKPTVVCGMTLIPIDPSVDPKMATRPKDDATRYTIRAIPPPICR